MHLSLTEIIVIIKALAEWQRKYPTAEHRKVAKRAEHVMLDKLRESMNVPSVEVNERGE